MSKFAPPVREAGATALTSLDCRILRHLVEPRTGSVWCPASELCIATGHTFAAIAAGLPRLEDEWLVTPRDPGRAAWSLTGVGGALVEQHLDALEAELALAEVA